MKMSRYTFANVALVLAACSLFVAPALSQQNRPAAPSLWGGPKPNDNPNNGTMVQLKEAVSLDNLPEFTGHKKFMYGTVREWEQGQGWSEYFQVKESAKDVLAWYTQVLQMQQWKIVVTNESQIMAKHKDGNTCQISAQVVRHNPASQCTLAIAYFVPKKTK